MLEEFLITDVVYEVSLSTRFLDRITCADRPGLRLCCGALLRTRTEALESESSFQPLLLHVKRLRIISCSRFMFFPELQTIKALLKSFAHKIYQEWPECFINVNVESLSLIRSLISHEILSRKKREKGKYRQSFWKERLLSRVRMGVLPSLS